MRRLLLIALAGMTLNTYAANPHKEVLEGPFATGTQVTAQCLVCHEDQATDVMKTSHWT